MDKYTRMSGIAEEVQKNISLNEFKGLFPEEIFNKCRWYVEDFLKPIKPEHFSYTTEDVERCSLIVYGAIQYRIDEAEKNGEDFGRPQNNDKMTF